MAATNRELRIAFLLGAEWAYNWYSSNRGHPMFTDREAAAGLAYPKQTRQRPKVVQIGPYNYWFENGELFATPLAGGEAIQARKFDVGEKGTYWWTQEDLQKLGALANDPVEEVEDESS